MANFNSFIIPWIMTGGGPSNASHIWITHIYELAFGRQRWGVASAYSVLLFIIMMTLGYFYVRALTAATKGGPAHERRMTERRRDQPPQADRRLALGRPHLPRASCSLYTAVPMVWMLLTSIKTGFAAMQYPPQWWPTEPTLANYRKLLDPHEQRRAGLPALSSGTASSSRPRPRSSAVIVAVPAAYAFSRFRFPGRNFLFFSVLLRNMFPAVIFLVPLFILMRCSGW